MLFVMRPLLPIVSEAIPWYVHGLFVLGPLSIAAPLNFFVGFASAYRVDISERGLVFHCPFSRREVGWKKIQGVERSMWMAYKRPLISLRTMHPILVRIGGESKLRSFVILRSFEPRDVELEQAIRDGSASWGLQS